MFEDLKNAMSEVSLYRKSEHRNPMFLFIEQLLGVNPNALKDGPKSYWLWLRPSPLKPNFTWVTVRNGI